MKKLLGIYHEYGSKYYEQTKHFDVFQSLDECINMARDFLKENK